MAWGNDANKVLAVQAWAPQFALRAQLKVELNNTFYTHRAGEG